MRRLLFFLFFLSGFSALIYEVLWARQLGLVFGNTIYAISAILSIFFAGLALGSYIFGRIADRIKKPFLIYGLLELGVGIYCFWTPFIFNKLVPLQVFFWEKLGYFSSFLLPFLVLIIPTVLMGGTFPVIVRVLVRQEKERGEVIGNLYGLNTLGAVLGAFLAGFFLIRYLGVKETIWLAAGINILVGMVILALTKRQKVSAGSFALAKNKPPETNFQKTKPFVQNIAYPLNPKPYPLNLLLFVLFLNGFSALALEVLWTRILILTFGSSTYAFSTILTVFLLGIALGSFLASKFLTGRTNSVLWLAGVEIALGFMVILLTPVLGESPMLALNFYQSGFNFLAALWSAFLISFLIILPVTLLAGVSLPLAVEILTPNFKKLSQDLGRLYSFNTLGGILGSLAAGFVLIPLIGLQKGVLITGFFYFGAGIIIVTLLPWSHMVKALSTLVLIVLAASSFFLPVWNKHVLSSGVFIYSSDYLGAHDAKRAIEKGKLLFYKEGLLSTVAVKEEPGNLYLQIDGKIDASSVGTDLNTELLSGHLPLLLHPLPKEVLVVGLGSGVTLGAVEQYGSVEKVDLVEIEPAVVEAASFFDKANNNALADKRLKVSIGDGRNFLLMSKTNYDVISSEPSNPWFKGNSNLFTKEYYQLAKDHLNNDGIFLQWAHLYYLDKETLKTVLATFHEVFPQMTVWSPIFSNDLLLIGTKTPLALSYSLLEKKFEEEQVKTDLSRIGISQPSQIFGLFIFGENMAEEISRGARLHSDNYPFLEFSAPLSLGKETEGENLEMLLVFGENPYALFQNLPSTQREKVEAGLKLKENIFRGEIALNKQSVEEALSYFLEAQKIDPNNRQIRKKLANLYFFEAEDFFNKKDFQNAKDVLLKASELDPGDILTHLNLGAIYYQEGNLLGAIKEWKIAETIDPENPEVKRNLELLKGN